MIDTPGGGLAIEMWQAEDSAGDRDLALQDEVWAEIHRVLALEPGAVTVEVVDGVAVLAGTIGTYAQKVAATEAAARTAGIQRIDDRIVVEPAPRDLRSDDALRRMVAKVLAWDSTVPPGAVTATVREGQVTLTGALERDEQRTEAEAAVSRLIGVRGIVNDIVVPTHVVDGEAKRSLAAAIAHCLAREGRHVDVGVRDGIVTLRGRVHTLALRQAAAAAVRQVLGDVRLENELLVVEG